MKHDRESGIVPCPKCEAWTDVSSGGGINWNYSDVDRCQDKTIQNCAAIRGAVRAYLFQYGLSSSSHPA